MPQSTHHYALARQWELLQLLPPRSPGMTATDLAEALADRGYVVSKRTIERDLVELSCLFPLLCEESGKPRGWYWMPEQGVELPAITIADALSLQLVEDLLRPLLPAAVLSALEPRFNHARRKLEALARDNRQARWIDKARYVTPTLPLVPPRIGEGILEAVQEALLAEHRIQVAYQRQDDPEPRSLELHPLGLVQRGPVSYLVATAFDYRDVRLYALHRILSVQSMDDAVQSPEGFSLDAYIAQGGLQFSSERTINLKGVVDPELAAILRETPLESGQTLHERSDGCYDINAELFDSWQLQWWLLSQGARITVHEPEHLRAWLYETAAQVMHNHPPSTST